MDSDDQCLRERQAALQALKRDVNDQYRLILASNRGPAEFAYHDGGWQRQAPASGGLATALRRLNHHLEPIWVVAAQVDDTQDASRQPSLLYHEDDQPFSLRFVVSPRPEYHWYYDVVSNSLLWPIHHSQSQAIFKKRLFRRNILRKHLPRKKIGRKSKIQAAWEAYEQVNQRFADIISQEVGDRKAIILLQDYHLYLVAGKLRAHLGDRALISLFIHIPWPSPARWKALPPRMVKALLRSCCALDIIGFHLPRYGSHFLLTCQKYLPTAEIDFKMHSIRLDGHITHVRAYPLSVDVIELQERVGSSARIQQQLLLLKTRRAAQTILRVDRIDPVKNIVRGFEAFERLLEQHPEHREKVSFLALLIPSRSSIPAYQRYLKDIHEIVLRINARFGTHTWRPIELCINEDYDRALAAMQIYDVLLVNSLSDGMNLVAKEGPTINQASGVLVLSTSSGAAEQLGDAALLIPANDVDATAAALQRALCMPAAERTRRANDLKRLIIDEDISIWIQQQLNDIKDLAQSDAGDHAGMGEYRDQTSSVRH